MQDATNQPAEVGDLQSEVPVPYNTDTPAYLDFSLFFPAEVLRSETAS
jgi:hypothetical protein